MASTLVGGALLSAAFQSLFGIISSSEFREFIRNRRLLNVSLVDDLKTGLLTLQTVLNDAEQKQITDPAVREWLDSLKDAIHDAEDLLDEINTEALRRKIEAEHDSSSTQVCNFLPSCRQFSQRVNSKLKSTCQRLKRFAEQISSLGLQNVPMIVSQRTPTSSVINVPDVVGRDDDREKLMNFLLSDDPNGSKMGVVTILGMGGVGKTALAQLIYNDRRVENHFDKKAWVCISEAFDTTAITKSLLESMDSTTYESNNLDLLQKKLNQTLKDKKFLFVLDDIWNNKYNEWDGLRAPFKSGKHGSRIIITTRQNDVADITHTFPIHHLKPLPSDDCWMLLAKHAFENEDPSRYPNLEAIGRKIAEKCDGLPLAAKALGGTLRSKIDKNYWNDILISDIWDLRNNDVLPALRLSYLYLPANVKRCFAYCSIFPKDYALDRRHVVLLWMAEGLLQQCRNKSMEQVGNEYFEELVSRSLIQQVEGSFVMHDLVNYLARIIAGKSCSMFENCEISESVRHLSYCIGEYDSCYKFNICFSVRCLRTFLPLPLQSHSREHAYLTERVTHDLLLRQKFLRVLSLANYKNITKLSYAIANLIHLRFLDLSSTPIRRLPEEVCKLYNLQTLRLLNCEYLIDLPTSIGKLVNLHHLEMSDTKLKEMPREIINLQNLQTLSVFAVSKQAKGLRLKDLRYLPNIQGKLSILELQNVTDVMDASEANLKNKALTDELTFHWGSAVFEGSQIETDVLDLLQPSTNLRKLIIRSYGGTRFPRWLGDFSFVNIEFVCISDCSCCASLPPLGQLPSLKKLRVWSMKSIKTIGAEFYGSWPSSFQPFPSLVSLQFSDMCEWEEWLPFAGGDIEFPFPCLKELSLFNCPKIRGYLPEHLPSSLIDVTIFGCNELQASTLSWITSIERLGIYDGGPLLSSMLENDSQNLLQSLDVGRCDCLTSFPKMVVSSNHIRFLNLRDISTLTSFPIEGLPTLEKLLIYNCGNLEFQTNETWYNYKSLQDLRIWKSCLSLTLFPLGCFPALKILNIYDCPNLKSISMLADVSAQSLCQLETLDLTFCPNLESLPQGRLLTPNLSFLSISSCEKLVSCPQGGLPPNLRSLENKISPLAIGEWGFQLLTCLSWCKISGDELVNTLLNARLLPTSLVSLTIYDVDNLKILDGSGIQHLSSLEELHMYKVKSLELLPVDRLPSSLKKLKIRGCPRLKFLDGRGIQHLSPLEEIHLYQCKSLESLPEDKLPPSLKLLSINNCPLLEERYHGQRTKHWSKIAHIPAIQINENVII